MRPTLWISRVLWWVVGGFVHKVGSVEKLGCLVRSACVSAALSREVVSALEKSVGKRTF